MSFTTSERVAALAVRRYGADWVRVGQVFESDAAAQRDADYLLTALVERGLLTAGQAQELHLFLVDRPDVGSAAERSSTATAADADEPTTVFDWSNLPAVATTVDDRQRRPRSDNAAEPHTLGGFRLLRRLGDGSMGVVYLGYHEAQGRQAAVKVLADSLAAHPDCVERFYRESKNSVRLNHPHIVRGFSASQDTATGKHYLVREFIDGISTQLALDHLGRLPVGAAVQIALDIARALDYLHGRQLVHRDIKPDNVLLTRAGATKLADLGLLQRIGEGGPGAAAAEGIGTSYYMPYEQAVDARRVDGRSDTYALGATLYHLLTGDVPFPGSTHAEVVHRKGQGEFVPARTLNPQVPVVLNRIVGKMLARRPEDRHATAAALVADLEASGLAASVSSFPELDQLLRSQHRLALQEHADQRTRQDLDFRRWWRNRPGGASWRLAAIIGLTLALVTLVGATLARLAFGS